MFKIITLLFSCTLIVACKQRTANQLSEDQNIFSQRTPLLANVLKSEVFETYVAAQAHWQLRLGGPMPGGMPEIPKNIMDKIKEIKRSDMSYSKKWSEFTFLGQHNFDPKMRQSLEDLLKLFELREAERAMRSAVEEHMYQKQLSLDEFNQLTLADFNQLMDEIEEQVSLSRIGAQEFRRHYDSIVKSIEREKEHFEEKRQAYLQAHREGKHKEWLAENSYGRPDAVEFEMRNPRFVNLVGRHVKHHIIVTLNKLYHEQKRQKTDQNMTLDYMVIDPATFRYKRDGRPQRLFHQSYSWHVKFMQREVEAEKRKELDWLVQANIGERMGSKIYTKPSQKQFDQIKGKLAHCYRVLSSCGKPTAVEEPSAPQGSFEVDPNQIERVQDVFSSGLVSFESFSQEFLKILQEAMLSDKYKRGGYADSGRPYDPTAYEAPYTLDRATTDHIKSRLHALRLSYGDYYVLAVQLHQLLTQARIVETDKKTDKLDVLIDRGYWVDDALKSYLADLEEKRIFGSAE